MSDETPTIPRFRSPSPLAWILVVAFLAFFLQGLWAADMSLDRLQRGAVNLVRFLGQAMPRASIPNASKRSRRARPRR